MSPQEFTYWLQGALELNPEMLNKGMTPEQVKMIQDHLNLVFTKVTPDRIEKAKIDTPDIPGVTIEDKLSIFPTVNWDTPGTPGGAICAQDVKTQRYC